MALNIGCRTNMFRLPHIKRYIPGAFQVRQTNSVPDSVMENTRRSKLNNTRVDEDERKADAPRDYKYVYPEFLPSTVLYHRDPIKEKLERRDMLKRRSIINIPEFYTGSIMAVTVSEHGAPGLKHRFVGICIERDGVGTRANFTLRNVVQGQGVEITYELYSPIVIEIECLKLEKRLDDKLPYLKDAAPEFSTIPFDHPKISHPPGAPVPVNSTVVKMNAYPWFSRWELHYFKGMDYSESRLPYNRRRLLTDTHNTKPWQKYDLMKWYRESVDDDTAGHAMRDVQSGLDRIRKEQTEKDEMAGF